MSDRLQALVLLSGGLDSAVTAAAAAALGSAVHGLTFRYGQRHAVEVRRASAVAAALGFASHRVAEIGGLAAPGSSALTDRGLEVPRDRDDAEIGGGIPETYVPARNTVFLAHALAAAEQQGIDDIFVGVNALDYSGYPDCRPEYVRAFGRLAALATRGGAAEGRPIRIRAPLLFRTKAEIIRLGADLGVDFTVTWSCYDPVAAGAGAAGEDLLACGRCDSCVLRRRGFEEAGVPDPTRYAR